MGWLEGKRTNSFLPNYLQVKCLLAKLRNRRSFTQAVDRILALHFERYCCLEQNGWNEEYEEFDMKHEEL